MDAPAVVIVNGSSSVKVGLNGEDIPSAVFPNVIGKPRHQPWNAKCELIKKPSSLAHCWKLKTAALRDAYIGDDAQEMRGILALEYPIRRGIVQNWDAMEEIWRYAFTNELKIDAAQHRVLMTETPLNSSKHRERLAEIMFERFNLPAFYVENPAWLAMLASSRKTGLVLHVGDGVTHALAIYNGFEIVEATRRVNIGGHDVTKYLLKLLASSTNNSGDQISPHSWKHSWTPVTGIDYEVVNELKEERSFVSVEPSVDMATNNSDGSVARNYELPDGHTIKVGSEATKCYEALFKPSLLELKSEGVHELLLQAIDACPLDIRKEMRLNILLSGGATVAPGFSDRLENELKWSTVSDFKFEIESPPERKYSSWIGGSVLSSLKSFQSTWITRSEYKEVGSSIVDRKCPSYGPS